MKMELSVLSAFFLIYSDFIQFGVSSFDQVSCGLVGFSLVL